MVIGFICVFAVLINKVCLQGTVEAVIGGSVLLPCSSTEHDLKLQDTDVHWRHNGSENVYDIVKGEDSLQLQDPRYKNRAQSLPEEYKRGNFSIKLNNLIHTDTGEFSCIITDSSELQTVLLIIKSTAGKESKPTEQEDPKDETGSNREETLHLGFIVLIIVVLIISILFIIGCFRSFYCRKKEQAPSFSFVRTEDKTH